MAALLIPALTFFLRSGRAVLLFSTSLCLYTGIVTSNDSLPILKFRILRSVRLFSLSISMYCMIIHHGFAYQQITKKEKHSLRKVNVNSVLRLLLE